MAEGLVHGENFLRLLHSTLPVRPLVYGLPADTQRRPRGHPAEALAAGTPSGLYCP